MMMLPDEELRVLNLQMAVQEYMMQQDAQNETTPLPFQQTQVTSQELQKEDDRYLPDGQNTRLSQVSSKRVGQTT